MNKASIKWANEEHEKKIAKMKQELELNKKIILDYEIRIKDLTNEIDSCQKKVKNLQCKNLYKVYIIINLLRLN